MAAAVAERALHHALHKRRVNDLIRDSLRDEVSEQPVAFFCECESLRCFESVWLTTADYETGRVNDSWSVRAPGHRA
jgi:hypothetical protein